MKGLLLRLLYRGIVFATGYGIWLFYKRSSWGARRRFPVQFRRLAGIICAVWLAAPFALPVTVRYRGINTATGQPSRMSVASEPEAFYFEAHAPLDLQEPGASIRLMDVAAAIWAVGFLAVLIFHLSAYIHMGRRLYRWRTGPLECPKEGICRNIQIGYTHGTGVPLVSGLFHPVIWLPAGWKGDNAVLKPALRHETAHLQQGDLWVKWILLWVKCLYWFHPAVFRFARRISELLELACDDRALKDASLEARKEYGMAILAALEQGDSQKLSFGFLGLWEEENQVLFRIRRIMGPEDGPVIKRGRMRAMLGALVILVVASSIRVQAAAPGGTAAGRSASEPAVQAAVFEDTGSSQEGLSPDASLMDGSGEAPEIRFHLKMEKGRSGKGIVASYQINKSEDSAAYDLEKLPCQAYRVAFPCNYENAPELVRNELMFYASPGTEVCAISDEIVTDVGQVPLLGKCIATESNGYEIVYSHLEESYVEAGDILKPGDVIGLVGATGAVTHDMVGLRIDSKEGLPADLSQYGSGYEW